MATARFIAIGVFTGTRQVIRRHLPLIFTAQIARERIRLRRQ
jgi:hypothetical protein